MNTAADLHEIAVQLTVLNHTLGMVEQCLVFIGFAISCIGAFYIGCELGRSSR